MTQLFSVTFNDEEPPYLCAAENEEEAVDSASRYASDYKLSNRGEIEVKLEGVHPDFEDFERLYSLRANPYDSIAGLGGALFGATGLEWEAVAKSPSDTIWTLIENEGIWGISPGVHVVNQLGFLLTNELRGTDERNYLYG